MSAAASLAAHLSSHGLSFRFVSGDAVFAYDSSTEHLRGVLTHLASVREESEPEIDLREWIDSCSRSHDVILVVPSSRGHDPTARPSPSLHVIDPSAVATGDDARGEGGR